MLILYSPNFFTTSKNIHNSLHWTLTEIIPLHGDVKSQAGTMDSVSEDIH